MDNLIQLINKKNAQSWQILVENPIYGITLANEASALAQEINHFYGLLESDINKAWSYIVQLLYPKALMILYRLKNSSIEQTYPKQYLNTLNAIGVIYGQMGCFDDALSIYHKGLTFVKESGYTEKEPIILLNIANIYTLEKKYIRALEYYHTALHLQDNHNHENIANILHGIAIVYMEQKEYPKALKHFFLCVRQYKKCSYGHINLAKVYSNMGRLYRKAQKYHKCLHLYNKSRKLSTSLNRDTQRGINDLEIAKYYFDIGNLDESFKLATRYLQRSISLDARLLQFQSYQFLSKLYEAKGNFHQALLSTREKQRLEREIFHTKLEHKFSSIEIEHQIRKEKEKSDIIAQQNRALNEKSHQLELSQKILKQISIIGQEIVSSMNIYTIAHIAHSNLKSIIPLDCFILATYHEGDDKIFLPTIIDHDDLINDVTIELNNPISIIARTIRERRLIQKHTHRKIPHYSSRNIRNGSTPPESIVTIPLFVNSKIVGAFSVQSMRPNTYHENHITILQALAYYFAISLENANKHKEIEKLHKLITQEKKQLVKVNHKITEMALHDSLTGLPNRRFFSQRFKEALKSCQQNYQKLALIFIDLNKFKPINDTFGHETGDLVLQIFSEKISNNVRSSDSVSRIGGDEFVIVIHPLHTTNTIDIIIKNIQNSLQIPITLKKTSLSLSASIGIALYPDDSTNEKELIRMADNAMYYAKKINQYNVTYYHDIPESRKNLIVTM